MVSTDCFTSICSSVPSSVFTVTSTSTVSLLEIRVSFLVGRISYHKYVLDFPVAESFEAYHSIRERRYAYYRIYVDNYIIYYVVIDDDPDDLVMEVRRFLYNGQNRNELV